MASNIVDFSCFRNSNSQFDDWIHAMKEMPEQKENLGRSVELLCRNSIPRHGCISKNALHLLGQFNRKEYVQELWHEATNKKSRFHSDCIESISMMDDLEFLKMTVSSFKLQRTTFYFSERSILRNTICRAADYNRWTNLFYLVAKYPFVKQDCVQIAGCSIEPKYWDVFLHIILFPNDRETAMAVIPRKGSFLRFLNESLRNDKKFILAAVKNGLTLQYADESLRNDKKFVLEVVSLNGLVLQYADESLRKDKEIVMAAVKQYGDVLKYADESLRKDKDGSCETEWTCT